MKKAFALWFLPLALAACNEMKDTPSRVLDDVGDNASVTYNKAREYAGVPRKQPKKDEPHTQARYCYRSIQDITCYGEPIPGQEDRLVAYQGSHGQTGYVILPKDDTKSTAPVSLPPLKSVTVNPPTPIKGVDDSKKPLKEIIFDPAELMPKELVPPKSE